MLVFDEVARLGYDVVGRHCQWRACGVCCGYRVDLGAAAFVFYRVIFGGKFADGVHGGYR